MVHPAAKVEDAQQKMEICLASFALKIICMIQMSQNVEMVSNLHHKTFALKVRCNGLSPVFSFDDLAQLPSGTLLFPKIRKDFCLGRLSFEY